MRIIETKVYQYDELSKESKQKAIENLGNINTDNDYWHDPIIEEYEEKLVALGYHEPVIHFTGFSSQGDGACFTSSYVDIDEWIKSHKKIKEFERIYGKFTENGLHPIEVKITHSWRHYFATSTTVDIVANDAWYDDELVKLEQYILDEREKLGNDIYRDLEKYYYELQKDEVVIDTIRVNEYEFTEAGYIFSC